MLDVSALTRATRSKWCTTCREMRGQDQDNDWAQRGSMREDVRLILHNTPAQVPLNHIYSDIPQIPPSASMSPWSIPSFPTFGIAACLHYPALLHTITSMISHPVLMQSLRARRWRKGSGMHQQTRWLQLCGMWICMASNSVSISLWVTHAIRSIRHLGGRVCQQVSDSSCSSHQTGMLDHGNTLHRRCRAIPGLLDLLGVHHRILDCGKSTTFLALTCPPSRHT